MQKKDQCQSCRFRIVLSRLFCCLQPSGFVVRQALVLLKAQAKGKQKLFVKSFVACRFLVVLSRDFSVFCEKNNDEILTCL